MEHRIEDMQRLFDSTFATSEQTVLRFGFDEPLYLPAGAKHPLADPDYHQVLTSHDYFASSLHEISHWCIAGVQRRLEIDYGYWYEADGRSLEQQENFALVEAKPQALEWILAKACGFKFRFSLDNLNASDQSSSAPFAQAIYQALGMWLNRGLPNRAVLFCQVLADFYQQRDYLTADNYRLEELCQW